jgi:hypothetical protein
MERYVRVNLLGPGPSSYKKNYLPGRGHTKVGKHVYIRLLVTSLISVQSLKTLLSCCMDCNRTYCLPPSNSNVGKINVTEKSSFIYTQIKQSNCWPRKKCRTGTLAIIVDTLSKYRVIKKSLCTWWLQYRKLQVMNKVSAASLQTFIDMAREKLDSH